MKFMKWATLAVALWTVAGAKEGPAEPASADAPEYVHPRGYVCYRASTRIKIDGKFDEAAWDDALWTDDFVDIEGGKNAKPRLRTRVKMLWDDDHFYIAALLDEPHVWATLTEHDSIIFHDNDFEIFIDPNGDNHEYYELEINAHGTTWDLLLPRPYKDGGKAVNSWEITGLKSAVNVRGTLNNPKDDDDGWAIELAIPWKVLGELAHVRFPPKDGDQWRVNFSRVEWEHEVVNGKYQKARDKSENNWVWSPQGVVDMHRPETWGYVQFSTSKTGDAAFEPDRAGPAKHLLHLIYYAQQEYRKEHKRFAKSLEDLGLDKLKDETLVGTFKLEVTESAFEASVEVRVGEDKTQRWRIRQDSKVWKD